MTSRSDLPVIAIPCCRRMLGSHPFHVVGEKYIEAVHRGARVLPWLVPALGEGLDLDALLDRVDGVVLTGSRSNVHPTRYHPAADSIECGPYDPERDATTLPLITKVLARGLPLLAICRGFQELNVALGGTLHPRVHEVGGMMDHRDREEVPLDIMYGPAHPVRLVSGGVLAGLAAEAGIADTTAVMVNSLHGQGIDTLSPALAAEAVAPDGLVEAVRVVPSSATDTRRDSVFAIGVQWHPEWRFAENPLSRALFAAFGMAARDYAEKRG